MTSGLLIRSEDRIFVAVPSWAIVSSRFCQSRSSLWYSRAAVNPYPSCASSTVALLGACYSLHTELIEGKPFTAAFRAKGLGAWGLGFLVRVGVGYR